MNEITSQIKQQINLFSEVDRKANSNWLTSKDKTTHPSSMRALNYDQIYSDFNDVVNSRKETIHQFKPKNMKSFHNTPLVNSVVISNKQSINQSDVKFSPLRQSKNSSINSMRNSKPFHSGKRRTDSNNTSNNKNNQLNMNDNHKQSKQTPRKKMDVGQRWYNYGFYVKNKINNLQKNTQMEINQRMSPAILSKSKQINRSSSNFQDRWYHNPNKQVQDYEYDNIYRKSPSASLTQFMKESTLSYTPELNKKSLQIANLLEPNAQRLTSKKKKKIKLNTPTHGYSFDLKWQTNTFWQMSNKSRSITRSPSATSKASKRCDEMYQTGVSKLNNRQKAYEQNWQKKENEYKNFSFKPQINSHGNRNNSKPNAQEISKENYQKQTNWKLKIDKRNNEIKKKKEYEEISKCTFTPNIKPLEINNDEEFIIKHIDQMNKYVNKRRTTLELKKEYEEYKNRKFGKVGNDYHRKMTGPKQFLVETEKCRTKSKDNKTRKGMYSNSKINNETNKVLYSPEDDYSNYNWNNHKNFIDVINQWHLRIENWDW